jgi:hypothetical protein
MVVEEQTESWHLRSGTWSRDPESESWRLAAAANGTVVNPRLSTQDLGRMIGASRDTSTGQWFPLDFSYSPQTGTPLRITIQPLDSPWVPPFGAPALSDMAAPVSAGGLRCTSAPLRLVRSNGRFDPAGDADRTLPALPPGRHRFLVHKFDVASPTLMAIEAEHGNLLVLLPESKTWISLEQAAGASLAQGLSNARGWRMEAVTTNRCATLYLPTANGLAAVTPTLLGLSYTAEHFGQGPALGGPVACAGEIWLPVLGDNGVVNLVGKPRGTAPPIALRTPAPAPTNGFEAPVFDRLHVIWPSEEGQLILGLDEEGNKSADWIAWPDELKPTFSLGCPYLSPRGFFWQPCSRGQSESLEYVQMGWVGPERIPVGTPRVCTGHLSYDQERRIVGDPWREPEHAIDRTSSEVVVPLIESELERAVVGLRIHAPKGIFALLESEERHHAVLQVQAEDRADVQFGTLSVARPWLASLFIYDAHFWVYHPELSQALGWKQFA